MNMVNGLFAGGDGTEQNPYLIEDAFDLDAVRNDLSAHYKLINDINLDVAPFNEGKGWNPLHPFQGVFDGNGLKITNLYINRLNLKMVGLFGYVRGAIIKNIGLVDVNIVGNDRTGALVGYTWNPTDRITIIQNCYSTGNIKGGDSVGGLVGEQTRSSSIKNSYSICEVKARRIAGGLIGRNESYIKNSYSLGKVSVSLDTVGGLSGYNSSNITIRNSFWNTETSGLTTSASGTGLTTQQMQTAQTFIDLGWNDEVLEGGTFVWILKDGEYPILWFQEEKPVLIKIDNVYYSYRNEEFIEVAPTQENFEQYSINLIELLTPNEQGIKPLMTLDDPEIVHLTDKLNPKLYIKGFRDLRPLMESDSPKILIHSGAEEGRPVVNVKYKPEPQLVLPTGDIHLKMLEKIHSFTIYTNTANEGNIKIVFSTDSGNTWQTYNLETQEFQKIDITNMAQIKEKGIKPDTFNTIGEKWNNIVTDDKIRFAYYLEMNSINDIAEVDKLEVKIDMHGRWRKAEHIEDYNYEYDNEHIYVTFFKDGSYKINYQG